MFVVSIFRWLLNLCWKKKNKNIQIWSRYSLFKSTGCRLPASSFATLRYRSRWRVITCDTPVHAIEHLYQIWKESILNCRCYRADTGCGTDGRTDGRTDGVKPIYPQQLRCVGGIINFLERKLAVNGLNVCFSLLTVNTVEKGVMIY